MKDQGIAVVTGASSGIGRALAVEFASHGHDLVITSNEPDRLLELRAELAGSVEVTCIDADLRSRDGVESLYREIRALDRPIDILAANAGIGIRGDFSQTSIEDELDIIQVNVISQVHLVKMLMPRMIMEDRGHVLITSSMIAVTPAPFMAIYAASKAFLHSWGLSIRNEVKDTGVGVTVLMPGATDTDFWRRAGMTDSRIARGHLDDPAMVARKAYHSLMHGKDEVVPGLANQVKAAAGQLAPEQMVADNLRDAPWPEGEHAPDHSHLQRKH